MVVEPVGRRRQRNLDRVGPALTRSEKAVDAWVPDPQPESQRRNRPALAAPDLAGHAKPIPIS